MKKTKFLLGVVFFIVSICLAAQEQADEQIDEKTFSISAQIRPRTEYRNGAFFPRSEETLPAAFVNNRARLSMDFKRNNLQMKMSTQHLNIWGEDSQTNRNGRVSLNEAWAKMFFSKEFYLQLGRQPLIYDDERLLGAVDWNIAGRFHDVLKFGYENPLNKIHLLLAYNQSEERQNGGNYFAGSQTGIYKNMQTLWYNFGGSGKPFSISLTAMNLGWEVGVRDTAKTAYMQTFGTYITLKPVDFMDFALSAYCQTGKNNNNKDVLAYLMSFKMNFKFTPKFSAFLAHDWVSGQKIENNNVTDKVTAFVSSFGTNHRFYGAMDYFYSSAYLTSIPGLNDSQLGISYKASNKVDMSLNYHYFSTHLDKVFNTQVIDIKKYIGSEFDFQLNWTIMKDVRLMGGYSFMLGTKTMDILKGGDHKLWQDWGWITLNINPQLFVSKWR